MDAPEQPRLYLISPPVIDLDTFPDQMARLLDAMDIACFRLDLASQDEDTLARTADALRAVAHERDVALVIADHPQLAERLGLDGVHLGDGARTVRYARKMLGPDAIVGCFCGTSRHEGMNAGEAGADYVSFGPLGATALGRGEVAEHDLFEWWSQVIEVPVVAEGGLTGDIVQALAGHTDFFGIGAEIWSAEDPLAALRALTAPLG